MVSFASEESGKIDAHSTADSLRNDFENLIRIFDRQLEQNARGDAQIMAHIVEAKSAAERGLRLSLELAQALRKDAD